MNGFRVPGSWAQPIFSTDVLSSCAEAAGPPIAIAPATSATSRDPPANNLDLILGLLI